MATLGSDTVINLTDRQPELINDLFRDAVSGYEGCSMAIGSYLCGNYFRRLCSLAGTLSLVAPYDLVLPIFAQHDICLLDDSRVRALISGARYLVVNDPGMLMRFSKCQNVRLGRLFFKRYRDHRYPEYEKIAPGIKHCLPLLDSLVSLGCRFCALEAETTEVDSSEWKTQISFERKQVYGCCENTPEFRDINEYEEGVSCGMELGTSDNYAEEQSEERFFTIYFHTPYRLVSTMRICEFASIGKSVDRKFVPDDRCSLRCLNSCFLYPDSGFHSCYLKYGRGIYDIAKPLGEMDINAKSGLGTIGPTITGNFIVTPVMFDEFAHENYGTSFRHI